MTTPAFPDNLRRALADGYGMTPRTATVRTEMDSGQARARRRFTRTPTTTALCFHFRAAEFAIFDGWWHDDLLDGTAWFTIQLRNGYTDAVVTARGMAEPEATLIAFDTWRVTWSLEVDVFARIAVDGAAGVAASDLEILSLSAGLLHEIVHVDYPATTLAPIGP